MNKFILNVIMQISKSDSTDQIFNSVEKTDPKQNLLTVSKGTPVHILNYLHNRRQLANYVRSFHEW